MENKRNNNIDNVNKMEHFSVIDWTMSGTKLGGQIGMIAGMIAGGMYYGNDGMNTRSDIILGNYLVGAVLGALGGTMYGALSGAWVGTLVGAFKMRKEYANPIDTISNNNSKWTLEPCFTDWDITSSTIMIGAMIGCGSAINTPGPNVLVSALVGSLVGAWDGAVVGAVLDVVDRTLKMRKAYTNSIDTISNNNSKWTLEPWFTDWLITGTKVGAMIGCGSGINTAINTPGLNALVGARGGALGGAYDGAVVSAVIGIVVSILKMRKENDKPNHFAAAHQNNGKATEYPCNNNRNYTNDLLEDKGNKGKQI